MSAAETIAGPIVLYDGVCGFCDWSVQFLIRRDPKRKLRFAALQSTAGQALLAQHGLPSANFSSVVLIADGAAALRSTAALKIAGYLAFPWPLLGVCWIVPRILRDWAYDVLARNRLRLFGTLDACRIPTPADAARFLG